MIEQLERNIRLVAFIAVVIVLVVLNIVFLMQWQSVNDDKATLETEKRTAEVNLEVTRVQYDVNTLQEEEAELLRSPFLPSSFPLVDLSIFIASGASNYNLTIDKVEPPARVGTEKIGGKDYPAYATKMTVKGSLTNIISFLKYLEGSAFTSLKIDGVTCTAEGSVWTAQFTVVVVSQR
jgi:hypothetical protein